jgi:hypothetical protein
MGCPDPVTVTVSDHDLCGRMVHWRGMLRSSNEQSQESFHCDQEGALREPAA